jgi:hypothetical protein
MTIVKNRWICAGSLPDISRKFPVIAVLSPCSDTHVISQGITENGSGCGLSKRWEDVRTQDAAKIPAVFPVSREFMWRQVLARLPPPPHSPIWTRTSLQVSRMYRNFKDIPSRYRRISGSHCVGEVQRRGIGSPFLRAAL